MNDGISKRIFKCAHMHLLLPLCVCVFLLLASAIAELSPEVWLTVDCMVALIGTVRRDPNQNPKTVVLSTAQAKITHFWDAFLRVLQLQDSFCLGRAECVNISGNLCAVFDCRGSPWATPCRLARGLINMCTVDLYFMCRGVRISTKSHQLTVLLQIQYAAVRCTILF